MSKISKVTNNHVEENTAFIDVYLERAAEGFTAAKVNLISGHTEFITPRFSGYPEVISAIASILPKNEGTISVAYGIDEVDQMENFQNACLHGANERIACSIAVIPYYPANLTSQQQIGEYLQGAFGLLSIPGWNVDIKIGHSLA